MFKQTRRRLFVEVGETSDGEYWRADFVPFLTGGGAAPVVVALLVTVPFERHEGHVFEAVEPDIAPVFAERRVRRTRHAREQFG